MGYLPCQHVFISHVLQGSTAPSKRWLALGFLNHQRVMLQRSPPPFSDAWEPQGLPGSNNSNNLVGWVLKTSVDIHASYMFDLLFLLNHTCICLYYLTYVYYILYYTFHIMYNIYIICIHIYIYVRTTIITSNGYYCYHIIT